MQESGYKLSAKRKRCGYDAEDETRKVCIITDYGISQVHFKNLERFNLDRTKLLTDLNYSVDAGAMILSVYTKYQHREPKTWFCRYNQGLKSFSDIADGCRVYVADVSRYLK